MGGKERRRRIRQPEKIKVLTGYRHRVLLREWVGRVSQ
jgi:hypothetical protein